MKSPHLGMKSQNFGIKSLDFEICQNVAIKVKVWGKKFERNVIVEIKSQNYEI